MDDIDAKSGFHWQSHRIGYTNPVAHKRYIDTLLKQLQKLHEETDPRKGPASAIDKDMKAMSALKGAAMLVEALAGWAIDHQIGLALEGREFVPGYAPQVRNLPVWKAEKAEVDHHRHEDAGIALRSQNGEMSQAARRQALINLIQMNASAMPDSLADELENALRALSLNEVAPILQKSGSGRKVGWTEIQLQLKAIAFVEFRFKSGFLTSEEAYDEVANAYGVSRATIQSWVTRLRDELGPVSIAAARRFAANRASYVAAEKRRDRSKAISMLKDSKEFGDAKLAASAAEYKRRGDINA